jgi:hypothetical protein
MQVKSKKYEYSAGLFAKRFANAWDYFCIATSGYLSGYRQARQDAGMPSLGNEEVEYEVNDGLHQLSIASFKKWKEEINDLPFDEMLKVSLPNYKINNLTFQVDDQGLITFQGTVNKLI